MIWKLVTIVIFGVTSGTLGLWAADREAPTAQLSVEVLNPVIVAGDDLRIKYHVRRYRSCEVRIDRFLYDGDMVRVVLDDLAFAGAPGPLGDSVYVTPIPIPRRFAEGPANYRTTSSYVCNPLHRIWPIVVHGDPVTFNVSRGPSRSSTALQPP